MAEIHNVPLELIDADPTQPRQRFDEDELNGLAKSIEREGLLQPISLIANGTDRYVLMAGERRLRAAKQLGWSEIPAIINVVDPGQFRKLQIIENVVRKDLNPVEYARGLKQMVEEGMSHKEIDDALGQVRGEAKWHIQLLGCCDQALNLIATGNLKKWVGWHLARLSQNGQIRALRIFQMRHFTAAQMVAICGMIYGEENQATMLDRVALTSPEQKLVTLFMKAATKLFSKVASLHKLDDKKPGSVVAAVGDRNIAFTRMQLKEIIRMLNWLDKTLAKKEATQEVRYG